MPEKNVIGERRERDVYHDDGRVRHEQPEHLVAYRGLHGRGVRAAKRAVIIEPNSEMGPLV